MSDEFPDVTDHRTGEDAMSSEHVEVLRNLSEVCRAAIKAGDWKVDGACDPDSLLRHADAAIASLSAPQPPAEAQRCTCPSGDGSLRWPCPAHPPPSAPVGVEGLDAAAVDAGYITFESMKQCADAWFAVVDALNAAAPGWNEKKGAGRECATASIAALAQQPAAADGVKCPWDGGSPCVEPMPTGMVYPKKPAPRAGGYLDTSGVEWNAWDAGQMEAYARAAYSDGWEAGYRAALRDHDQEGKNG